LEIIFSFLGIHKWEPDIYIGFSPASVAVTRKVPGFEFLPGTLTYDDKNDRKVF
jgi:hypothetical protein